MPLSAVATTWSIVTNVMTVTTAFPHGLDVGNLITSIPMQWMGGANDGGIVLSVTTDRVFTMSTVDGNSSGSGFMLLDLPYRALTIYGNKTSGVPNAATLMLSPLGDSFGATFCVPLLPNLVASPFAISDKRPEQEVGRLSEWYVKGNGVDGLIIIID